MLQETTYITRLLGKKNNLYSFYTCLQSVFVCLLLSSTTILPAQNADPISYFHTLEAPDSILFDTINNYYKAKVYSFPDSVLKLSEFHIKRAEINNNLSQMIEAQNYRAIAKYIMEDYEGAIQEFKDLVALAKQIDDEDAVYRTYNNMGNVFYMQRDLLEAFRYYNFCLPYFKNQDNIEKEAGVLLNIGLIYVAIDDYDRALANFEQTLEMKSNLPEIFIDAEIWHAIASIKHQKEMYPEAIVNYNKALALYEAQDNPKEIVDVSKNLAKAYCDLGVSDKAIYYAQKGIALSKKWNYDSRIIPLKAILADIYRKEDLQKATDIANEIRAVGYTEQGNYEKVEISEILYNIYKVQNNTPLALEAHENYSKYSDSLNIEINKSGILKQKIEYEYQNQLQQKELGFQEQHEDFKKSQYMQLFSISMASILTILGILLFAGRKLKRNRLEKQNLLKEVELLKSKQQKQKTSLQTEGFQLNRKKLETVGTRPINETDWKVLNILLDDPFIKNALIAEKAFMSVDGIGSSLRRMYQTFNIKDSRYMKVSLLMEVIKISK